MTLIHHGGRNVSGRKHVGHTLDPHELIDRNAAEAVVLDRELTPVLPRVQTTKRRFDEHETPYRFATMEGGQKCHSCPIGVSNDMGRMTYRVEE
jgi:hypothetical protein